MQVGNGRWNEWKIRFLYPVKYTKISFSKEKDEEKCVAFIMNSHSLLKKLQQPRLECWQSKTYFNTLAAAICCDALWLQHLHRWGVSLVFYIEAKDIKILSFIYIPFTTTLALETLQGLPWISTFVRIQICKHVFFFFFKFFWILSSLIYLFCVILELLRWTSEGEGACDVALGSALRACSLARRWEEALQLPRRKLGFRFSGREFSKSSSNLKEAAV